MTTITQIFGRKKRRWLQRLTGIHRIHHPRHSYGYTMPLTTWCYFPAFTFKNHNVEPLEPPELKARPARWAQCARTSYHDCTTTGVY